LQKYTFIKKKGGVFEKKLHLNNFGSFLSELADEAEAADSRRQMFSYMTENKVSVWSSPLNYRQVFLLKTVTKTRKSFQ